MDITPSCGCDRGVSQCGISNTKAYPIIFLELYELIFTIGFILLVNSILVYTILTSILSTIKDENKDGVENARTTSFYFMIFGFILIIIGFISYIYHRNIK